MNCQDGVCGCDGPGDKKGFCLIRLPDSGVGVGFFHFGCRLSVGAGCACAWISVLLQFSL